MNKKIVWWSLIIVWCAVIFLQSNKPALESMQESGAILNWLNHMLTQVFGVDKVVVTEGFVRKSAHFIEYFVLGCLIFKGIVNQTRLVKVFLFSWVFGTIYAITDEIHQYFVPGRAMQVFDMLIDSIGIFLGVLMMIYLIKKKLNIGKAR